MKTTLLGKLNGLETRLKKLWRGIAKLGTRQVERKSDTHEAAAIAHMWVGEIRSSLEHRFLLPQEMIDRYADGFKGLFRLSQSRAARATYEELLKEMLRGFTDDLIVPVQQTATKPRGISQLATYVQALSSGTNSDYLREAVGCAQHGFLRAGVVMAWCSVVEVLRACVEAKGYPAFGDVATNMKAITSGRFRRFNKELPITTSGELQEVLDKDLILVLEFMGVFDANQSDRLSKTCYQLRCQSAHPGQAPVKEENVLAYFSDIVEIVLSNEAVVQATP